MATDLSAKASLYTEGFSEGVQKIREKLNTLNTALVQNAQEIKKTNHEIQQLEKSQRELAAEMQENSTYEQTRQMQELSDKLELARVKLGELKSEQTALNIAIESGSQEIKLTTKEINSLIKEQQALSAEMKDGGTNEQKQRMQELSAQIAQTNEKLGKLKTTNSEYKNEVALNNREIKETIKEIGTLTKQQDALSAAMRNDSTETQKQQMEYLSDKVSQANVKLIQLKTTQQELKGELRNTTDELTKTAQKAGDAGKEMQGAFTTAAEALKAAGIAAAIKEIYQAFSDCVSVAMEFGATMSTVEALSGANANEIASLTEQAKQLGATTKFTANEAAEAMSYMAMAGWDAQEMMNGMDGVLSLAAAAGESLALTADIVTDNLTAFGLSASDAAHFSDVLATAATNSNTSVSIMGETFKQSASVAGALGYSIEDVATAVGLMANAGVKGSIAGTALKNTFNGLLEGATLTSEAFGTVEISAVKADGTMKSFGETVDELRGYFDKMTESERVMNAMDISGARGYNGLLAVLNATDEAYTSLKEKIDDCAGAAENMAKIKTDNLAGDITLMDSALDGLKNTIGGSFEPELRELVKTITAVVSSINDFTVNNEGLVKSVLLAGTTFAAFMAAFVGAPAAIHAVEAAMKALTITMSVSPWMLVVSAVAALTVGLGTFIGSLETAEDRVNSTRDAMSGLTDEVNEAGAKAKTLSEIGEAYDELGTHEEKSAEDTKKLEELQRTLNQTYGIAAGEIDLVNGKYEEQREKIDALAQSMDNYARATAEDAYKEMERSIELEERVNDQETGLSKHLSNELVAKAVEAAIKKVDGEIKEISDGTETFRFDGTARSDLAFEIVGDFEQKYEAYKSIVEELDRGFDEGWLNMHDDEIRSYYTEVVEKMNEYGEKVKENEIVQENYNRAVDTTKGMFEQAADSAEDLGQAAEEAAKESVRSFDEIKSSVSSLVKETKTLTSAFAEQNENGSLSAETILSLADAGYAAALAVDEETGAVRLDAQAYRELAAAKLEAQRADIEAQKAMATAGIDAKLSTIASSGSGAKDYAELEKEKKKLEAEYDAQLMALDAVNLSKVIAGGGNNSSSSSSGRSSGGSSANDKDEELEEFKKKRAALKHEYDMGRKEKEDYYKALGELYDEYVKKVKEGADSSEMRSTELELYKYDQSLKPAEKSGEDIYKELKSDLDFRHNMGEVSEKNYYKKLKELRDKYLKEGTDAWKSATLAIHKYDQSLAEEKASEAKKQLEDNVNERIALIDEEIAAKKKASDEAIAAIDAEVEARRRANEDADLQHEMDVINAQLNYSQLDDFSRFQLERKLGQLQEQQAEKDWERSVTDRKAAISSQYDAEKEAAEAEKQAIKDAADHFEGAVERSAEIIETMADSLRQSALGISGLLSAFSGAAAGGTVNNYSNTEQKFSTNVSFGAQPFSMPQIVQAIMDALKSAPVF